ncbi:MSHA biogenesis protein MshN [Vibrio sp. N418]|uniref:tetratricopeptide repeat protein n=1 Tax=Vibrio sp. (strain N418) TaxID=701176 RepID=UPI00021C0A07|nr:tetratricopeptide repeat protein [Vibrio sp. N418]EGU34710.1 MSHA biogenesis protein MshN [Vibrio sp. N418]
MSAINNALSELSKSQTTSINDIERVQVQTIKQKPRLPWLIGGFSLSLAVGGWAISLQAPIEQTALTSSSEPITQQAPLSTAALDAITNVPSPTAKVTQASEAIYSAPVKVEVAAVSEPAETNPAAIHDAPRAEVKLKAGQASVVAEKNLRAPEVESPIVQSNTITAPLADVSEQSLDNHVMSETSLNEQPLSLAKNSPEQLKRSAAEHFVEEGAIVVEQVELTPTQLSFKAQERAKKALDANNLAEAIAQYNDALRYTPRDSKVRQTLAALYYGKGDARKAVDLLQKGIAIDNDDMNVRLALSKLLLKEQQNAAALTPLVYLPANPSRDYLSLRAALAQKNNQDQLALESYQQLVTIEPENGRWWLGYAIQQERAFELQGAKQAYQQALTKVGVSSQSQQFIRDRLSVLNRLEEQPSAD